MVGKIVVFDFDGTIADTLNSMIDIVNKLSDEFGYNRISAREIPQLQEKKPREILKHLGISLFKLPRVVKKIRSEMNEQIISLRPATNIKDTLIRLKENDCSIGILTSNSKQNVTEFLQKNDLDIFDFIYSGKSVFGKSHLLKNILKLKKTKRENVFYVADEIRDIYAAKKSKIKVIGVSWGFNTPTALKKENPNYLVESPEQLVNIIIQ